MMTDRSVPLAERMRPQNLDDFVGQYHLLGQGHLLRRLFEMQRLISAVFWGPPGTGKTTLAKLLAKQGNAHFVELSAVSSGAKEMREVFQTATEEKRLYQMSTVLFVDEVHRYTKTQQDVLLPAIERGVIQFMGSTTENPRICLTPALLSRVQVFQLYPLARDEIERALKRALKYVDIGLEEPSTIFSPAAWETLVDYAGGDLRRALNALEWSVLYAPTISSDGTETPYLVSVEQVKEATQGAHPPIDESLLYDMLSAFGKSLRGSDSDAALYWFMRMLDAGVDPRVPLRRLIVHASEDVGLASPQALQQAIAALHALEFVGMPEARIPIAQAIIFVCESPKSNSVVMALARVQEALRTASHARVPLWLRDKHYARADDSSTPYLYPHDFPNHYVEQQYLPDELSREVFYQPTDQGTEGRIHPRKEK